MKKVIITSMIVMMFAGIAWALTSNDGKKLSGAHYNLNIIGVKDKTAPMDDTQGHSLFVKLDGKTRIMLAEGADFEVTDRNGTDGDGAAFTLPNPDPDNTGTTLYSVFARALGKPGGKAKMVTGAYDPDTGEDVYSVCVLEVERTKGKPRFENVSKELLYIYAYIYVGLADPDGIPDSGDEYPIYEFMRLPLFAEELQGYFWDYDNNGLKLLQLRFYEGIFTTVPGVVDSVVPDSGEQGADNLVVTITGEGIALGSGANVVFSNDGISIVDVVNTTNDTVQVTIDIDAEAAVGEGYLTVTSIDTGEEWIGPFEVVAAP
jgi:hypothetical protein